MNWVPVILVCWVLACFVFVVWFCVLSGFVLCVFAVCLVYDDDGPMYYVQVLPQFSFAALNSRWPGTLICNYCSCNVIQCGKRPGESHEGVGRKKNMLRTDQTVGSSVTNARVVTVSGVTWTSFVCSHAFGYVSHGGVGSLSTGSPSGRGSGRSTSA